MRSLKAGQNSDYMKWQTYCTAYERGQAIAIDCECVFVTPARVTDLAKKRNTSLFMPLPRSF